MDPISQGFYHQWLLGQLSYFQYLAQQNLPQRLNLPTTQSTPNYSYPLYGYHQPTLPPIAQIPPDVRTQSTSQVCGYQQFTQRMEQDIQRKPTNTSTTNINVNIINGLGQKCCQYRLDNKTKLEEDLKKEQIQLIIKNSDAEGEPVQEAKVSGTSIQVVPQVQDNNDNCPFIQNQKMSMEKPHVQSPIEKIKYKRNNHNSKNIPKNMFKGLIKYIVAKKDDLLVHFHNDQTKVDCFIAFVKKNKSQILSMQQYKDFIFQEKNEELARVLRIMSFRFVSKEFPSYIYNSKIKSRKQHLSHRKIFLRAIISKMKC